METFLCEGGVGGGGSGSRATGSVTAEMVSST